MVFKRSRRRVVMAVAHRDGHSAELTCRCRPWGLIERVQRDFILADLTAWAWLYYKVQLKMLARGEHVAICELVTVRPGDGRVRKVMEEICLWADCSRIPLELSPSDHWGADVQQLTNFYASLGFQPNNEPHTPFRVQEDMIRYPVQGRGHGTT